MTAQFDIDFDKADGLVGLAVIVSLRTAGNPIYHHALKIINKHKSKYIDRKALAKHIVAKAGVSFESFMLSNVILVIYPIISLVI